MLHILLYFRHIKFNDVKKEIHIKILFNFFVKHFQTLSRHAPSGVPTCSPSDYVSVKMKKGKILKKIKLENGLEYSGKNTFLD